MGGLIHTRRVKDAAVLELSRDGGIPRLDRNTLAALENAVEAAAASSVAGIVIAGTEQAFAAGAELAEVAALGALEALQFSALGQGLMRRIAQSSKPVVAAIRGFCLGGGLDLALACTARVASPDAVFGHPGASLGIITGWGGTARLPRQVGRARALEMLTTGARLNAQEAFACGLVARVVPAVLLLETAIELAVRSR